MGTSAAAGCNLATFRLQCSPYSCWTFLRNTAAHNDRQHYITQAVSSNNSRYALTTRWNHSLSCKKPLIRHRRWPVAAVACNMSCIQSHPTVEIWEDSRIVLTGRQLACWWEGLCGCLRLAAWWFCALRCLRSVSLCTWDELKFDYYLHAFEYVIIWDLQSQSMYAASVCESALFFEYRWLYLCLDAPISH